MPSFLPSSYRTARASSIFHSAKSMLMTEWRMEDALAVRYEEGLEKVARNALAEGFSVEQVHKITGLNMETIARLKDNV